MKTTAYFDVMRTRPDRAIIEDAWIERAIQAPLREIRQLDGRIRRWTRVPEMENRYLRVILLEDGETVHNAFFDRDFELRKSVTLKTQTRCTSNSSPPPWPRRATWMRTRCSTWINADRFLASPWNMPANAPMSRNFPTNR